MESVDRVATPLLTRHGTFSGRVDAYPTHEYQGYNLRVGKPFPFGATLVPGGVNFSVYSSHATSCSLVLFAKGEARPAVEIPFEDPAARRFFRIGNVFTMVVFDLDVENVEYGYRLTGPDAPRQGHRFDASKVLLDPYAKAVGGRDVWGTDPDWGDIFPYRGRLVPDDFDWGEERPLETPIEDLIIYEMHVRGFTRHPSSGAKYPGTFAGIREKIPYLLDLGVNCVELLPIYEFDEFEHSRRSPVTGQMLMNYWGYSTIGFFAPKAGYAANGKNSMQVDELKGLVRDLHSHGIEVILDVVFNHTAEGNEKGPHISFRGLDNKTYYMLTPEGYYFNFSGCGNTLNCNHPIVRDMVLDCLRYWAAEYHIDGFRFDLASILGRDPWGAPMSNPPLLESLAFDPVLAKCKLIAEAWDAGGLYQVGSFPGYGRWAEWNGKYRDCVRKFLKGDAGQVAEMARRLQGSPDLYGSRGARTSVNFITCHDGFTLYDLVSYDHKHNEANGEENRDGCNDNDSWNCGWEGPTADPGVNRLRFRQIKNALAMLLVSQGVPMILMGDEVGHTQKGNNNAYCQDNEISWLDWGLLKTNAELFTFCKRLIAFRKACPLVRGLTAVGERGPEGVQISWHGVRAWSPEWAGWNRTLAFVLTGHGGGRGTEFVYVAMNMHWEAKSFELPLLPEGYLWRVFVNTWMPAGEDCWPPGAEPVLSDQHQMWIADRSVVILVSGVAGGA